ncbi:Gfo/Idh/MocA family oxidoreductase [Tautonia plasticadhaerens]|uniref:Gfo/Idh/MocA family oxidoreductase n=1 Tax=Tautonia plasticadhaerens TaxID=2527974 RepID=UPI0018D20AB1|nr:Gfo/Idh/MocA family oxidoreductase [Tautonia plasticadhaerens]
MSRSETAKIVRVGVVGLGRAWADRYRSPMTRPGVGARVVAVCDPVVHRSEAEADRLRCDAVEGVTALIDRPDVDAVLVLDDPWFGAWPLGAALDRDKPVFCAFGPRAALDELARRPSSRAGTPVMIELPRRFSAETLRLRELLATELGPARRARARARARGPSADPEVSDLAIGMVDWCGSLFQDGPGPARLSRKVDRDGQALRVVELQSPGGASSRLTLVAGGGDRPSASLAVEADRGWARIDSRGRLRWSDGSREVEESLPDGPPTELMIDHFLRLVRGEQSLAPGPEELARLDAGGLTFEL